MKMLPHRILVDANFLVAWKGRGVNTVAQERASTFIAGLDGTDTLIVIPTPAIAEYLVKASTSDIEAMHTFSSEPRIVIAPFDYMAALKLHLLDRAARCLGDKKDGVDAPWQKIKIDRQLVAIAHSQRCDLIISNDRSVTAYALKAGILCCTVDDLHHRDIKPVSRLYSVREDAWATSGYAYVRADASGHVTQLPN